MNDRRLRWRREWLINHRRKLLWWWGCCSSFFPFVVVIMNDRIRNGVGNANGKGLLYRDFDFFNNLFLDRIGHWNLNGNFEGNWNRDPLNTYPWCDRWLTCNSK